MKGMTTTFAGGIGHLLASWQVYAMVAVGVFGMLLVQSAMNAGKLLAAQSGLTLADPVLSVLWGVLAFHERVRSGWFVVPEVIGMGIVAGAVVALARSPLLSESSREG